MKKPTGFPASTSGPASTPTSAREVTYLDNAASTRVHPQVAEAMARVMAQDFGNPSSRHAMGLAAEKHISAARETVAQRLGVVAGQVVFTSGATEANALALLGSFSGATSGHALISAVEHPSVLQTAKLLARRGLTVQWIPVDRQGRVVPDQVDSLLRPDTALVAVMHVNNETGAVQPLAQIGRRIKARSPQCRFLVDAVQSFGRLPLTLDSVGADLLSLSAHKIHGPKGVGCLAWRAGHAPAPLWGGGEQEAGLRPGTENVPGAVGLAQAVALADEAAQQKLIRLGRLLRQTLAQDLPQLQLLCPADPERTAPHIVAVNIGGIPAEVMTNFLDDQQVVVSSGSACHSRSSLRSHVLQAMNVPQQQGVIRLSLGFFNSEDDVGRVCAALEQGVARLGRPVPRQPRGRR